MEISKVWLITEKSNAKVLVEIDGKWYEVINTCCAGGENTISHCVYVETELPPGVSEVEFNG